MRTYLRSRTLCSRACGSQIFVVVSPATGKVDDPLLHSSSGGGERCGTLRSREALRATTSSSRYNLNECALRKTHRVPSRVHRGQIHARGSDVISNRLRAGTRFDESGPFRMQGLWGTGTRNSFVFTLQRYKFKGKLTVCDLASWETSNVTVVIVWKFMYSAYYIYECNSFSENARKFPFHFLIRFVA